MKKIFVGNLSFRASEADVRAEFARYGKVGEVNIVHDRDTGKPRRFGFVEMVNDAEAENAIKSLNGLDLDGRTLSVNEARPKPVSVGSSRKEGFRRRNYS